MTQRNQRQLHASYLFDDSLTAWENRIHKARLSEIRAIKRWMDKNRFYDTELNNFLNSRTRKINKEIRDRK